IRGSGAAMALLRCAVRGGTRPGGGGSASSSPRPSSARAVRVSPGGGPMTPGPVILVGGAEFTPGNEEQDELFVRAAAGATAFAVPTAAARQRPDLAFRQASEWFEGFGLELENLPVLTRTDAALPELSELAKRGGGFYLLGGEPGLTVDVLRDSLVWDAIATAWRSGAVPARSAAGAVAVC